jgi:transmembrane sensor
VDRKIKELFERYQSGSANDKERRLVEEWFDKFEQGQQNIDPEKKAVLFKQMDAEINHMLRDHHRHWLTRHWLQAAAVFLICFGAALFAIFKNRHESSPPLTYTLISAPNGVKKQLSLPDGTFVYLNSGSNIRIPSNFGTDSRQVLLSGEAFFIVKHDPSKPFKINTGKLTIADIGTSFDVKSYLDDAQIRVAVESGKVSVEENNPDRKPLLFVGAMTRNQQLIYDKKGRSHTLNNIQASDISAWKENKLRFDNASFEEITLTLERWYNVSIKLSNNANNNRRYTVSFNNEPVSKVLKVLEDLSGMTYQINNKAIFIHLKPSKKS